MALKSAPNPLNEPLVNGGSDDEMSIDPGASNMERMKKMDAKSKSKLYLVSGVSMCTMGMGSIALVTGEPLIGMVGCVIGIILGPFVIINEIAVATQASKRGLFNMIREEANRMSGINDELHDNVDEVEAQVDRTKRITAKLEGICDGQSSNVEKLVECVKENGEIIEAMKLCLAETAIQTIIRVVLSGDNDRNFLVEGNEVPQVALKVYIELGAQGMKVNLKMFQEALRKNPSLEDLVQMLKNILNTKKGESTDNRNQEKTGDFGFLEVDLDKHKNKEKPSKEDFWVEYERNEAFGSSEAAHSK
eukprot:CAMPEP_0197836472 /NCGR_PEP_ID=MMETSP1437-20131217/29100_1 /TAXON_ID=49252 ORGANISM="Eucampia antarctica, Strain CCMP1452" /NCGR_SAMPLE_ID=MMETSP1437 /ASSEMBLY_ACC=CAM_ASM_001096 /LENGTH=304 /DNA_ID=CAMNT_0043442671 /DNA_START=92 /DNA_END=1006 /DNA_ORIENTATION=-